MNYDSLSRSELLSEVELVNKRYAEFKSRNISLDMSRGKPGPEQLDISSEVFNNDSDSDAYLSKDGIDCRN